MTKKTEELTEAKITEFYEYFDERIKQHNSFLKKVSKIREDMIAQMGEILLNEINKDKLVLRENQLGVGISDEGIEIRIHLNKHSSIDYNIMHIDWDGNIKVFRINDPYNLIDTIMPIITRIIPKY